MKTSGLGNITIRKQPKTVTINLGMLRSTSAGAKLCPRAYEKPRQASGMNCPYAGHESESRASVGGGRYMPVFLASCFLAAKKGKTRGGRGKLSLHPHTWPLSPIPWLALLSHVSSRPHASHFSASGAAAGPRPGQPTRSPLQLQHTPRGSSPATPGPLVTTLPLFVHVPFPSLLSWMNHLPGSGERVHGPK